MKALFIMKWIASIILFIFGAMIILWGVFCFFGGPDPGAGSGIEGPKYGVVFTVMGLAVILAGRGILILGKKKN